MVSETQGVLARHTGGPRPEGVATYKLKTRAFELACCYIPRAAVTKTRQLSCAALVGRIARARGRSYNRAFGEDGYLAPRPSSTGDVGDPVTLQARI